MAKDKRRNVRPDNGMISESFSVFDNIVYHQAGDKLLKKAELKNFFGDGNEFKTIYLVLRRDGSAAIYLGDALGASRLVLDSKVLFPLKKFKIGIKSEPLDIKRLAIWENR
jgi:hypothetical protein